jgi:hypothetical protein
MQLVLIKLGVLGVQTHVSGKSFQVNNLDFPVTRKSKQVYVGKIVIKYIVIVGFQGILKITISR